MDTAFNLFAIEMGTAPPNACESQETTFATKHQSRCLSTAAKTVSMAPQLHNLSIW